MALVNAASFYDGSSRAITKAVTSGNLLIFCCQTSGGSAAATPTSSPAATWTSIVTAGAVGHDCYQRISWAVAPSTANITVTAGAGGTDPGQDLYEFSGRNTVTPVDQSNGIVSPSSSNTATLTLTGVADNSDIYAMAGQEGHVANWTATSPLLKGTEQTGHSHMGGYTENVAAGNPTPTAVYDGVATWWTMCAVSLAVAAAGALSIWQSECVGSDGKLG